MPGLSGGVFALAVAFAVCLSTGPQTGAAQTTVPSTPAGDAVRGKSAFLSYGCYECHGTVGQGNFATAPHLAPHPLPYAALVSYIRRPAGSMPSYSAMILPDRDAADIYAYLASIASGKSAAQIPILSSTTLKPK